MDGIQLLTMTAACVYMAIGAVVGFIAGLIIVPAFCIGHPLVLIWWERHRAMIEVRKNTREASKILATRMREINLTATKDILMRHKEEDFAAGLLNDKEAAK